MLNIVFMGTPDFARDSLEEIYNAGHKIQAVVTVPDKAKGRGMKMIYSPVKEFAIEKNIEIYQPERLKGNDEFTNIIKKLNPDVICVVAYGKILPEELINVAKLGTINVHPSLLPKYRGSAPIQWAILNGDKTTGVSTMYLNSEMDAGDIILQKEVEINDDETSGELWDRLSKIGAKLLGETVEKMEKNEAPRIKQEGLITIAPMIEKSMAKINWEEKNGEEIKNLVRGLNPILGAYTMLNDKKIKIWKVEVIDENEFVTEYPEFKEYRYKIREMDPGTIIYINNKKGIYVKTRNEILLVLEVQQENSKKMSAPDFLRGNKIEVAEKFE